MLHRLDIGAKAATHNARYYWEAPHTRDWLRLLRSEEPMAVDAYPEPWRTTTGRFAYSAPVGFPFFRNNITFDQAATGVAVAVPEELHSLFIRSTSYAPEIRWVT